MNQPKLTACESYYFRAFHDLTGSRTGGEGIRAIPVDQIKAYFETWGINTSDERETMTGHLTVLDNEYMAHAHKKMEAERNKTGGR